MLQQIVSGDPEKKSNCVRLLDHFVESGHLCIVCEKMDQNLRQVLQTKPAGEGLPLEQVREYGRQIFVALRYMSKLNLVHNDIKIDNMLLTVKKSRFSGAVRKVRPSQSHPYHGEATCLIGAFGRAAADHRYALRLWRRDYGPIPGGDTICYGPAVSSAGVDTRLLSRPSRRSVGFCVFFV